ncbi:MAG TPA: VOC family protein [Planctomycetota bacterium]|nr:VOC family protein [Planctomycetota bacterium]
MATTFKSSKTVGRKVKPVPKGYHTLTPGLTVKDAAKAIDFYKKAFNAVERSRMGDPDGRVMHAELEIGDSLFMIGEEMLDRGVRGPKSIGGTAVSLNLYLDDADATFKQAVGAGAKGLQPVGLMFWGDLYGKVEDPYGHIWGLCTRVEDLSPEEIDRRGREWMSKQTGGQG